MNMNIYSVWAGFGFLILLALGFAFFLSHLTPETGKETRTAAEKPVVRQITGSGLTGESFALLKLAYYSIISLIILHVAMILLLIT
jgi:hypothetical protein